MRHIDRSLVLVAGLSSFGAGCADASRAASDTHSAAAGVSPPIAPAPTPSAISDTLTPNDSVARRGQLWDSASVDKRLESAGLAPVRSPARVTHSFMSVPGVSYHLGEAELQVFVYPDARALGRDVSRLDSATVAPRGQPGEWRVRPTLITSNNLAAILLSRNERQIERVQLALTAGLVPPQ